MWKLGHCFDGQKNFIHEGRRVFCIEQMALFVTAVKILTLKSACRESNPCEFWHFIESRRITGSNPCKSKNIANMCKLEHCFDDQRFFIHEGRRIFCIEQMALFVTAVKILTLKSACRESNPCEFWHFIESRCITGSNPCESKNNENMCKLEHYFDDEIRVSQERRRIFCIEKLHNFECVKI